MSASAVRSTMNQRSGWRRHGPLLRRSSTPRDSSGSTLSMRCRYWIRSRTQASA